MSMTREEARTYIESTPDEEPAGLSAEARYDWGGRKAAKTMLAFMEAHPQARGLDFWEIGDGLRAAEMPLPDGITGFQVGYALNLARFVVGEPPTANPAILTIEIPDE